MTFTVSLHHNAPNCAQDTQLRYCAMNLIHEFVQSIGGAGIISKRDEARIPVCQGITEWAEKKYRITIVDNYTTEARQHAYLAPNPMDGVDIDVWDWAISYIPFSIVEPPWGHQGHPTKDEERLFMDPAFVGPRTPADRKFFHSEAIKMGFRKKQGPSRTNGWVYGNCQTPELKRWQDDVIVGKGKFETLGLESATEWAAALGYRESRFWTTSRQVIDHFDITLPGCEGKPDTVEKLLFVLKFIN